MGPKDVIEINLVDSFVLNKIGEGHGESRLYLGGKNSKELIGSIFNIKDPSNQVLAFSKKNIISTVKFFEPFFLSPKGFYLDNGKLISFKQPLSKIFDRNLRSLESKEEKITEQAELLTADGSGRCYLRVNKNSLLRHCFLPHSVKLIMKENQGHVQCSIKPEIIPIKKPIKVNGEKHEVEFDYLSGYDFECKNKT